MSVVLSGPFCGCMGCDEPAVAFVRHPDHGRRAACDDHADGLEVIEHV